jgi:hypothetical protein
MSVRPLHNLLAQGAVLLCSAAVALGAPPSRSALGHGARKAPFSQMQAIQSHTERLGLDFLEPPAALLGPIDEAELMFEDETDAANEPMRFGIQRRVSLTLDDGQWVDVAGGRLWRCRVEAIGSMNTRLHLRGVALQDGQELFMRSPGDAASVVGPITDRGERGDGEVWGVFSPGPIAEIEWFVPDGQVASRLPFTDVEYAHGYRDVFANEAVQSLTGCRNDPACFPDWADISNATGRILYTRNGANRACSGQLLATTAADETPYFSTAYHCISAQTEANSANVRFFFRVEGCGGTLSMGQAALGADLVAAHASSDSTLLMIRGALPSGVHWMGWKSSMPANGTPIVTIHHPQSFQQAISFGTKTANGTACNPVVSSSTVLWNLGVTEGGSSGSALVEQSTRQMFGVLSCGISSCANTTGWDAFGRWDLAVNNGGFGALLAAGSDDTYEPNDACAVAAPIIEGSHGGLVVKRLSPDWYAVEVPIGGKLSVQSSYTHANGDVDFRVWDACGGTLLAESLDDVNNESFLCTNTSTSTTVLLEVFLSTDTRADYTLTVRPVQACTEDLDGDGEVGGGDVSLLLLAFGSCPGCVEDFDGDGEVGASDLSLLLLSFGACP